MPIQSPKRQTHTPFSPREGALERGATDASRRGTRSNPAVEDSGGHGASDSGLRRRLLGLGTGLLLGGSAFAGAALGMRRFEPGPLPPARPFDGLSPGAAASGIALRLQGYDPSRSTRAHDIERRGQSQRASGGEPARRIRSRKLLGKPQTPKITQDQSDGLSGTGTPGSIIEGINLSKAAPERLHLDDVVEIARVGRDGKFHGKFRDQLQGTAEGDILQLRARDPSTGEISGFVRVKAHGLAPSDTKNALLASFRVSLVYDENKGVVAVGNMNPGREISEPGAQVAFKNVRTGTLDVLTLDGNGTFASGAHIRGRTGDAFDVAVSDGENDVHFSKILARLTVPGDASEDPGATGTLPEPKLHADQRDPNGNPLFAEARISGPLFDGRGPEPTDPIQGQIGDCYAAAAASSLALHNGAALRKFLTESPDGKTVTAHFKEKNWTTLKFDDHEVGPMSKRIYVRPNNMPLYGADDGDPFVRGAETWFPMFEKALATRADDSYDNIGRGGSSAEVFSLVLGKDPKAVSVEEGEDGARALYDLAKAALDARLPAALGTFGESQEKRYFGTRIYADHAYSLLGHRNTSAGLELKLRNPWGEQVPDPSEGNGIFWIKALDASKLFENFFSVSA